MLIKEIQILSEVLWDSVKTDLKFFSSIQTFVKKLAEFDFIQLDEDSIEELVLYVTNIENFFQKYRSTSGDFLYIPPNQTSQNDDTVKRLVELMHKLKTLKNNEIELEIRGVNAKSHKKTKGKDIKYVIFQNGHKYSKRDFETIEWYAYNTGNEAKEAGKLKHDFNKNYNNKTHCNTGAQYLGHHYVECRIKRNHSDNIKLQFPIFVQ